jgi:formate dehydrogenase iron-sulfur subunit
MPETVGFFTDVTLCIGCKACQVACHQWNDLPAQNDGHTTLTGNSYDNTGSLTDVNWRHVKFIEQFSPDPDRSQAAWMMMSDVCKHCVNAPCLEVCPTGAILRTEFDTVYINEPACNGCRDCVSACPFGVIHMSKKTGIAQKCTFCYDRLKAGLTPACAQACPTKSISFGPINKLKRDADTRLGQLRQLGLTKAELYGADDTVLGGLNAFYLLPDRPEVFGLPADPKLPSRSVQRSAFWAIFTSFLTALGVLFTFRSRTKTRPAGSEVDVPVVPAAGSPGPSSSQPPIDTTKDKEQKEKPKKGQEQPKKGVKP